MTRPALEVADIFRDHGPAWRAANAGHVSLDQLKVMSAIERCRTAALGGHVARGENGACGHTIIAYNSCRNRHCPKCQGSAAAEWLEARAAELLPIPYFHVVYPHVHMIVPGGGLSPDGTSWVSSRGNFLVHVKVLARKFRGKLLAILGQAHAEGRLKFFNTHAGLADARMFKRFIGPLRHAKWIVYCKAPFAGPEQVLRYLSRYTHRIAISNRRLVSLDDGGIAFRWKDYRQEGLARWKTMTLAVPEFIRRFLIHVLPKGFHRIRHYGLLANGNRAENIARARELLGQLPRVVEPEEQKAAAPDEPRVAPCPCPRCGARMLVIEVFAKGCEPRWRPAPALPAIRIDTS